MGRILIVSPFFQAFQISNLIREYIEVLQSGLAEEQNRNNPVNPVLNQVSNQGPIL